MGLLDSIKNAFGGPPNSLMDPERKPEPESRNDQSSEEIALVQDLRTKLEESRSSANRIAHEGIWMTNCAYVLGYDGLMYNTTARQFQPINRASAYLRKNRIHVNKILPTVQNRLARLCQNPPEYDIAPETNDVEDKDAAKLALQVLDTLVEQCEVNKKRLFLYMWLQQCGHAYVHVKWDPLLGEPMLLEDGTIGYQGDVTIDVESPFAVFPDPYAKTDDDAHYLTLAKVRPLHYFEGQYPERGRLVKPEQAWLLSAQYEQRISSLNSRGPSQGGMSEQQKNSAIEMVRYERPTSQYPRGRMIAGANGILLDVKELPIGEIPLSKFDDTIIGGKYYSETPVTHARPIQDQYNETIRRRAEWTRRLLAGKYKAPRGSGIAQEALNDESGELLYYNVVPNAASSIEPLPVPTIPEYAYKEEDRLDKNLDYIFGIGDVSRGILPSASIPAIGAQLLQEQDQTRLSIVTELLERSWSKVFRQMLKEVETNYEMPRKKKLAGKSGEYIVTELHGKLLRGNTDVRVIRGSTLPNSKTLKRQDIVNTMNLGLMGDPKSDPGVASRLLEALEFGQSNEIWEDLHIDRAQIKRGMDALEKGEFVAVDKKDNNILWCQELNRFRKSDKWSGLTPEIQSLFEANLEDRMNQLMPPGPTNTPMPTLPPMPPPPIGAGGEAVAGLPPGVRNTALAQKLQSGNNQRMPLRR